MSTNAMTIGIIVAYLAITMFIGFRAAQEGKKTKTMAEIFTASRTLGILALSMAIFGSQITAFGILGGPGIAYRTGYSAFGYIIGLSFAPTIGFYIFGSRAWVLSKKFNYVTPVQFFGDRYGKYAPRFVAAFAQVFLMIPYVLILGIGSGAILESLTDGFIPYWLGALVILIVCTYTAYAGGMKGTAWTNIFQGTLMLAVMIALMYIVYNKMGGGEVITENLPDKMLSWGGEALQKPGQWIFYSLLATGISNGVYGHLLIRNMSAASPKTIQLNAKVYPVLSGIFWFTAISLGVWGSVAITGLDVAASENIAPLLAFKYAPTWMIGVLGAGILSAIMSSWDGMILVMSSIFSEDVYKPLFLKNKQMTEEENHKISKRFIIIISVVIYVLVLMRPGSIIAIGTFSFAGMASITPAYFGCLYWKRSTSAGVIAAIVVGIVSTALWAFGILPAASTFGLFYGAAAIILSIVALVVVSLLTKPADVETVDHFFSAFSEVYED